MTKIKNTKKGMAKKTLSMSLVVAMLATSNVPVWAAEFSDGTDAAVETEALAAEAFSDNDAEAPVVEDTTKDAEVATAASDYDFSNITVNDKMKNPTWAWVADDNKNAGSAPTINTLFKTSTFTGNGQLQFAWAYNGAWDKPTENDPVISGSLANVTVPTVDTLKNHVNETLSLILVEKGTTTPIANFSFGTIQPVDLGTIGVTVTAANTYYNGAEQKPTITVANGSVNATYSDITSLTATDYEWSYSGNNGLTNAGSNVTVSGTLKTANKLYTGSVKGNYTIGKLTIATGSLIVKVTDTNKEITYTGNNKEVVDNSLVNVYLPDAKDNTKASDISLNEYIKKVTVDASATGRKGLLVTLDGNKLKKSANYANQEDITLAVTADNNATGEVNTIKVEPIDLASVTATLKNPLKLSEVSSRQLSASDFTFTKDGKELSLTSDDISVTITSGTYDKIGTYKGAIVIAAKRGYVKNSTVADLVIKDNTFAADAKFMSSDASNYLTTDGTVPSKGLDYNNGKAVEFNAADLFNGTNTNPILGWFDPTGVATTSSNKTEQSYYRVKYKNNVNATGTTKEKLGVLTVYAVGGDYDGCSKDFYFKINPSTVKPSDDKNTTVAVKAPKGVAINEANTGDAAAYADAIGLVVNGTNGAVKIKDQIISNATANDYKVAYSFVQADGTTAGANKAGDYVKAVITLNKDGNFTTPSTATTQKTALGVDSDVKYETTASVAGTYNGTITLYVPILNKSVESLDVSLDQSSYTFTGTTIKPKVSVKLNGKAFVEGEDYTVSVKNGINVGTAEVTVTMLANSGYQGTKKLSATITPAKISDVKFAIKKGKEYTYDATQKKPSIAQDEDTTTTKIEFVSEASATAQVKLGSVVISQLFDITYGTNVDAGKDAGTVTLTPKAAAAKNFDGSSVTATFDIKRRSLKDTSTNNDWAVKLVNDDGLIIARDNNKALNANDTDLEWTGNETIFANASLVDSKIDIVKESNENSKPSIRRNDFTYKLAYANNVEKTTTAAPAYVCVVGTGNYGGTYSIVKDKNGNVTPVLTTTVTDANKKNPGTYEVLLDNVLADSWATFQIAGRSFAAKNVTITNATYAGGVAVKPGSVVKDPKTGAVLTEGKDYELVFDKKNVDATTTPIEVSVKGIGQYKGSLVNSKTDGSKLTFTIDKKDLKDCSVSVDKNLKLTVMNGNVLEEKENFTVKDNGDGTATVSVVDGGKNYTGSVNVEIGGRKVGAPMISNVKVVGNKATVILSDEVEGASGYDYVISTDKDCITNKDYTAVNKNQAKTSTAFKYVDKGTYYAYCHAWTRDANGKKVFGEWSNGFQFSVTTTTPDAPVITSVKVSGSTIKVTYKAAANATGYDVVLGTSSKKDNGELRPYNYGAHKKLNIKEGTVTATFKNVPAGTWTVGMHAFNRTSIDGKKVFSPWSNLKTAKVK